MDHEGERGAKGTKHEEHEGAVDCVEPLRASFLRSLRVFVIQTPTERYPDTAMEMLRWITRAVGHRALDLGEIQAEIQRVLREKPMTGV